MADYDNEQDFTGAVIAKIKQLFESRTARIVMAAVLAAIAVIILAVVMLSGGSGEEFENSDLTQAVRDENSALSEAAPESEENAETTAALKYPMIKISSDSPVFSVINNAANPYRLSVEIAAEGYAESNLAATESGYSAFMENESTQGTVVELAYKDGLEVEKVRLMFEIKDSAIENTSGKYADTSDEFKGIKRFDVFMYDEELNMQLPIETKYDLENNIVYAETDRCGTYALVDMEILLDMLDNS